MRKIFNGLKLKFTYTRTIVLSFALLILIGTILLTLPVSSRSGTPTPILNAAFTATSATCVTGLVAYDTYTHWSLFGQIVIITLIQIGALGFMTVISLFSVLLKKKLSVYERRLLMQSESSMGLSATLSLLRRIITGTFAIEFIGAVLLSFRFCRQFGFKEGIFNAVFHSVSAFCNAGFDIMGKREKFSSFTTYADDPLVCLTIMALIVIGGIGFLVWSDIAEHKFNFKKYSLHSKIVLTTTAILLTGGTVLYMIFEEGHTLNGSQSFGGKVLRAGFMSVSTRTAGMNTIDLTKLSDSSEVVTLILMLIGGSPGSTAGGLKTTTLAVLVLSTVAAARHDTHPSVFKKRLSSDALSNASAIFVIYMTAVLTAVMIIACFQNTETTTIAFEVVSAIGTVGMSQSLTPTLCGLSKLIIMALMFGGRVGGLSLLLFLAEKRKNVPLDRPQEKILIG